VRLPHITEPTEWGLGCATPGHVGTSVRGDANFSAVSVYGCEGYTLPDRCDGSGRVGSGRVGSARCESECVSVLVGLSDCLRACACAYV
jgi:hypothetical protein